ncbi:MAG: hypothetical protein KAV87_48185 [Desulfobacteraceae bacterium]|nr:hypothetical protein [Desulfobacteraceae bacterium]
MSTKQASEDNRSDKWPVAKKHVAVTIDPAVHTTIGETDVLLNGEIVGLLYDVPALDGTVTVTFKLEDKDDVEYHTKASIAENAKTLEKLLPDTSPQRFAFAGIATLQVTASGAQSSTNDINVLVYMR